jgi:hypothetical protein
MEVSGQLPTPAALTQINFFRYPLDRRLREPQSGPGHYGEEKDLALAGNRTPAVQPVACCYTDPVILALELNTWALNLLHIWHKLRTKMPTVCTNKSSFNHNPNLLIYLKNYCTAHFYCFIQLLFNPLINKRFGRTRGRNIICIEYLHYDVTVLYTKQTIIYY